MCEKPIILRFVISLCCGILLFFYCNIVNAHGLSKNPVNISDESITETEEDFRRAVVLMTNGYYEDAKRILHKFEKNDLWDEKAEFLLGKLYLETESFDNAREYLIKAVNSYPLLKDYSLKYLTDVYIAEEKFTLAIETARLIKNKTLHQAAQSSEISALVSSNNIKAAQKVLSRYIKHYAQEFESKLLLARLLKNSGKRNDAIRLLKDVYINANPVSLEALKELEN
jgi:tetratricopeptide (TPR) repeat protein